MYGWLSQYCRMNVRRSSKASNTQTQQTKKNRMHDMYYITLKWIFYIIKNTSSFVVILYLTKTHTHTHIWSAHTEAHIRAPKIVYHFGEAFSDCNFIELMALISPWHCTMHNLVFSLLYKQMTNQKKKKKMIIIACSQHLHVNV